MDAHVRGKLRFRVTFRDRVRSGPCEADNAIYVKRDHPSVAY